MLPNASISSSDALTGSSVPSKITIGVRAGGGGGRGGLQPPQILGNSDFLGSKRKFGQSHFLKTFL